MTGPRISVIIPALNATESLGHQLDAMLAQDPGVEWELVVVDNGSDDGTAELAKTYCSRLPCRVVVEERRGANRARNAGIAATTSDVVLFTDADDIVGPSWVRAMADAVQPGAIVGGWLDRRHLPPDTERQLDPHPISAVFRGEWLPYPIGCCMGWDRAVLQKIGGFDDDVIYGGDEVEAIWRAQLLGAKVLQADAAAVIIRRERADLRELRRQARAFGRAEVILSRRFQEYGHPGQLRRRAAWRAAKAATRVATTRGPGSIEDRRRLAYNGAAARQTFRHAFHLDPVPETSPLARQSRALDREDQP